MAKGKESFLHDPVPSSRKINVMESGLTHCADSMNSIRGEIILTFGSPGDPGQKSAMAKSNLYGKAPRLFPKFQKGNQR